MESIIQPLEHKHEQAYLDAFSAQVRTALRVANLDSERQYIREQFARAGDHKIHFYGIFNAINDTLLGALQIRDHSYRGQLYTWLHHDYWGKGIFQYAVHTVAEIYFAQTGALFFDATVDIDNIRSYKALKKSGFADLAIQDGSFGKQFVVVLRSKRKTI
jgi:RimJ/RimL family protein N-acetyltransferase